ncbi:MAG: glycosyltransferase [Prevotella sp.]|nr:glycosyltransferase [Prevotella sp.]MDY4805123.1 glycosyltransferase [Prevotella sp.]
MKILLIGEASFLHNTLKKGLLERGHRVLTMSDGNGWHDAPRDIDLRRDGRWGKLGGLRVVWQLLRHLPQLCGNDVVQIHNYQFVPLMYRWNTLLLRFLKLTNRRVVKGCFGDDPQIFRRQAKGVPAYSDTYWSRQLQNAELHRDRIAEVVEHGAEASWRKTTHMADALVACLYEYWLDYNEPLYAAKLHYIPLPMECEEMVIWCDGEMVKCVGNDAPSPSHPNDSQLPTNLITSPPHPLTILIGLQPKRDFMKGAMKIAAFVEEVARRHPGKVQIKYVEGVPYDEYMHLLAEADVLVDQLYSYTPSMNSLAAMARGTVVIGGGEEEYYEFIGEKTLRPIINVRPDVPDEENIAAIERALFTDGTLERMAQESIQFVHKYHDYRHVAEQYEQLYRSLLAKG